MLTKIAATTVLLGLSAVAALAQSATNDNQPLISVGLNPAYCQGPSETGVPFNGPSKGVVNVHYNVQQKRLDVNVSVHDAQPNTTFVVDIRCKGVIGGLQTNKQGTGTAQISLPSDAGYAAEALQMGTFYVDISVPNGGGGAFNYGETHIAGPFNLK